MAITLAAGRARGRRPVAIGPRAWNSWIAAPLGRATLAVSLVAVLAVRNPSVSHGYKDAWGNSLTTENEGSWNDPRLRERTRPREGTITPRNP